MSRLGFPIACLAGALLLPADASAAEAAPAEAAPVRLAQAAGIDAPSTVDPGASVMVTLSAPRAGGRIELWGPVTQSGRGTLLGAVPATGATGSLTAPARPGSYELRQVGPGGSVLARKTLDVAAVPVILSAPRQLSAGLDSPIVWRGPGAPGDRLRLVDPASGAVVAEAPAVGTPGGENVTEMRAPETLGDYRLQYWSGTRNAVLRTLGVSVVRGRAWLRTPAQVRQGERFTADWHGPVSADQAFRIVDPVTGTVIDSQPGGDSVTLTAPRRGGRYRVQYLNTETGHVFSDLPLRVLSR